MLRLRWPEMTARPTISVLGILSWMQEHQSDGYTALDEIAAPFQLKPDRMLINLQWLQRYECVKRGGTGNTAWSITDRGRVRLAEGRFTPNGAILSSFGCVETFSKRNQEEEFRSIAS